GSIKGASHMSARHALAALLLGAAAYPAAAQDAQSLVAKNLEARGGAAALDAIKSVSFQGRTIFPGDSELTYKETRERRAGGAADPRRPADQRDRARRLREGRRGLFPDVGGKLATRATQPAAADHSRQRRGQPAGLRRLLRRAGRTGDARQGLARAARRVAKAVRQEAGRGEEAARQSVQAEG